MKSLFFLIFLTATAYSTCAQNIVLNEPNEISLLMRNYTSINKSEKSIKGWRIQIVTTDDRRTMDSARNKFTSLYPGVSISWKHVSPYYKVKVGAYETKMQLMGFLQKLKDDFPGAIPIIDDVKKEELIRY